MLEKLYLVLTAVTEMQHRRGEGGATAVEYGLMVAFIALAIGIAVGLLGGGLDALFQNAAGCFSLPPSC